MPSEKLQENKPEDRETGHPNYWEDEQVSTPAPGQGAAAYLQVRLKELQDLLAAGLITPQEYDALKAEVLAMGDQSPDTATE